MKACFKILDAQDIEIAEINGDWKGWNFVITDETGQIGIVTKKWNGAMKELFTTADKYFVEMSDDLLDETKRQAIASTAIAIDMIIKEA
ncbi:hypothetical protein RyT2_04050 [Pseudolactococcus yaeyamensis]